ncbi:MAG: IS110 family transposase [Fusobacteriales bacterium]|nr:IS110 family transposase [Fusobacteriales bacterium]
MNFSIQYLILLTYLLHTITGIGFTNAAIILSEIGDISKFDSEAKLT